MKGMLKAELFKFSHSYSLWSIIAVLVASCSVSIITGTYSSAENALINISKDSMVLILSSALYGSIILTDDFSNGLLRHFISNGYKRGTIILAKFVHYIVGCSILIFAYQIISVSLAALIQSVETSFPAVMGKLLFTFLQSLPLYWGIFGLFFLIAVLIKKGVIVVSISVAASILFVVFTNKFYNGNSFILQYSPIIQINEIANGTVTSTYFVSVLLSLAVLGACVLGSIIKFDRDELYI